MVTASSGNKMDVRLKVKIELPYDLVSPLLGHHLRRPVSKRHRLTILLCSNIYHSQDLEETKMSINRKMQKGEVVHLHNGILAMEKNETVPFAPP